MINKERQEKYLQRIKDFRLLDNDFMNACFSGDTKCTEIVVRIVLEDPNIRVMTVMTQYNIQNLKGRSVRLDVHAVDGDGRIINIEIQRADKGAGFRRARYNNSLIDAESIPTGQDPESLPEVYVIFITENDVIGKGFAVYHVDKKIRETDELFNDGSHILYVNGSFRNDSPIGKLMHDFSCSDPNDMYFEELAEKARYFKEKPEGVERMCQAMEEIRLEAIQEGRIAEQERTALEMLKGKEPIAKIARYSNLSVEKIQELQQSL